MKADEPAERVVKYGMAAMDEDKLVERHFKVTQDDQAITAFHFAHALRIGPWLRSKLGWIPKRTGPVALTVEPELSQLTPADTAPADDLRKSLGLS
jgi:hypothetical protein